MQSCYYCVVSRKSSCDSPWLLSKLQPSLAYGTVNSEPFISPGWGTALVWVCTDVGGNRACGCWIIHTPCRTAGVTAHRAHVCMCQLGHADKDGHREEKSVFTWWKLALSSAFSQKRWLRKKERETKNRHIQHTFYTYKYISHCLPLKYFSTSGHWKQPL